MTHLLLAHRHRLWLDAVSRHLNLQAGLRVGARAAAVDLTPEFGVLVSDLIGDSDVAAPLVGHGNLRDRWFTLQPNPSRSAVDILYSAPARGPWNVSIFDVGGHRVRSMDLATSTGILQWDRTNRGGQQVAPGVYFVRFTAGEETQTGRMTVLR